MPTPAFALKFVLGEMADALLLSGQRAVPAKAEQLGFAFTLHDVGRRAARDLPITPHDTEIRFRG